MTYSVAFKGIAADAGVSGSKNITLSDDQARPGGQALAASTGLEFLCKGPDGAQFLGTIDAERSDPDRGLIYILRQGP